MSGKAAQWFGLEKRHHRFEYAGTIDADYRGELGIILVNLSAEDVTIIDGERIAQLVFCKVEKVNLVQVQELGSSERGEGGFGSTGVK